MDIVWNTGLLLGRAVFLLVLLDQKNIDPTERLSIPFLRPNFIAMRI